MNQKLEDHFATIREELQRAGAHLSIMQEELERLERVGMFDAIPTESWQARNGGDKKYLYLLFPQEHDGTFRSPTGKKKVYVGCKTQKIADARVQVARRRRYDDLHAIASRLADWIAWREQDVATLAQRCGFWTRADSALLGPDPSARLQDFYPGGVKR